MNEYQNTGENCAFLQCKPWRRYSYVWISKIIRSSSSHMYYYLVVLKNLAKFTGTHLHRGFFSTCNLQLHRKRDAGTQLSVSFAKFFRNTFIMENLLRTDFEQRILRKMVNRHSQYNKKYIMQSTAFLKKTDTARESVYLRIYIYIGSVLTCSSQWLCLYILSSKGANRLQVLYIRTLGNIQGNFSTEGAILKRIPNFFLEVLGQLKSLLWKIISQHIIQPIRITPRFCKLSSLVFLCIFLSYIDRNHKDTTHHWGRRLDTALYIDQNASQPVNLNFRKSGECGFFSSKNLDIKIKKIKKNCQLHQFTTFHPRKTNIFSGI